jgi:putative ABC transport system permease protein
MNGPHPPAWAEWLLAASVADASWRDGILGDLREEFGAISARDGRAGGRAWYWRQALRLAGRFTAARVARRFRSEQSWIAVADHHESGGWRRGWVRDLRCAWRAVVHRPALAGVVVVTLALALAANAAIFSLMDAIVLRPYRFAGVERVVLIASDSPAAAILDRESVAPFDLRAWQREVRTVSTLAAYEFWEPNLSEVETPEQIAGFRVSPRFFQVLGMQPVLGRTFTDAEATPGQHRRALVSHRLWTRRFGADPAVVGRTIRLDGEPFEVVGVAPAGFQIPFGSEVWAPLAFAPGEWDERQRGYLGVIGRLADGASVAGARAEITALAERHREQYPDTHARREAIVLPFPAGMADPGARPMLGMWQAAAALLLLIACANVANLLLARGAERAPELGIRVALGVGRGRLACQMILEGAILASIAAVVSLPLSWMALQYSRQGIPPDVIRWVPGWEYIALDRTVLALTGLLGAVATVLFSLLPAIHASRTGVSLALRHTGRGATAAPARFWIRHGLAGAQVALTLALLFGSGLMLTAVDRAINGSVGFDKNHVMTAQLTLPERPYESPESRRQFIARVTERMQAFPAATVVGVTSSLPYGSFSVARQIFPEGVTVAPAEALWADHRRVSGSYFAALQVPVLAGRTFDDRDGPDALLVAMVSRNFAEQHWPGQDPLGRRFRTAADGPWLTVIGVSGDVLHSWFLNERRPTVYRPIAQDPPLQHAFVIRTAGDPAALAGDLRRAIAAADPHQPIAQLATMDAVVAQRTSGFSFIASALGLVALIALVLSVTGVYSLMAYTAGQRTKEIGVRLALGASRGAVLRLTTRQAMQITAAGLAAGTAMAVGIGQVMQSLLRGIVSVSTDLPILAALVGVVAVVSAAASYFPARAATRVDPVTALRAD